MTYQEQVKRLLRTLKENGWEPEAVNYGCGRISPETEKEFIEEVLCTDSCHLTALHKKTKKEINLFIVLGNNPGELVADYSCPNLGEDKMLEEYSRECEE